MLYYFIFIFVVFLTLVIYDNSRFVVSHYSVDTGLSLENKISAVQISDIHKKTFGTNDIDIINTVNKLNPDIILLTGDIVSRDITDIDNFKQFISGLLNTAPVYFVYGNHEKDIEKINISVYRQITEFLKESGVHILDNSVCRLHEKIYLYGITIPSDCYKKNGKYKNLRKISCKDINRLIGTSSSEYNILMAHNPLFFDSYSEWGADLTVSGHVHGGIVRLPFIKGLLSPERKLFPRYTSGLYKKNVMGKIRNMIVSRGLGKLRIFNSPEIIFLSLY